MLFMSSNSAQLTEKINELPKSDTGIPLKKAFNPLALPKLLPNYLLVEIPQFGQSKVLIAGERVTEDYGFPLKNTDLLDLAAPEEKIILSEIHRSAFSHPCAIYTKQQMDRKSGPSITVTHHSYPLVSSDDATKYLLIYFENLNASQSGVIMEETYITTSNYCDLQFINIGNGVPSTNDHKAELISSR